jgi:long-subunit acyl-CoA synthetase (AMP-forming)
MRSAMNLNWIQFWHQTVQSSTSNCTISDHINHELTATREIWQEAEQFAQKLKNLTALKTDRTIVISLNSHTRLLRDIWASALAGSIILPVSASNLPSFLTKTDLNPSPRTSAETRITVIEKDSLQYRSANKEAIDSIPLSADTVLILSTSGTSHHPTLVPLTSESIIYQIKEHASYFHDDWQRKRLCLLPTYHIFGLILDLFVGLYQQQSLIINPSLSLAPRKIWQTIANHKIEMLALVPRLIEILVHTSEDTPKVITENLHLHTGGAPLRLEIENNLNTNYRKLTLGYGLTEAGGSVLLNGVPLSAYQTKIHPTCNNQGTLWIKSEYLSPATKCDKMGYFNTNDLAYYQDDKRIEVIGRFDQVVKTISGKWLPLTTLEHQISQLPSVVGTKIKWQRNQIQIHLLVEQNTLVWQLQRKIKKMLNKKIPHLAQEIHCHKVEATNFEEFARLPGKSIADCL